MIEQPSEHVKVSFELSADDMAYFRERLQMSRAKRGDAGEAAVVAGARKAIQEARVAAPPAFILTRIEKLEFFIVMLEDAEWRLEGEDRARILDALAYFADPDDLIPDHVPGIGLLDDAIMVELVVGELAPEIEAYEDFIDFREDISRPRPADDPAPAPATEAELSRDAALAVERETLQRRMRRRSRRSGEGYRPMAAPFRLF